MNRPAPIKPLPILFVTLAAFGALIALSGNVLWQRWLPAALWHTVFAMGAMPLILFAMAYFTPVLTRTPMAPPATAFAPLLAWGAGMAIVTWFVKGLEVARWGSPILALAAVVGLGVWQNLRARNCLGPAHAGLAWYAAALICLAFGLLAVELSAIWPEYSLGLRTFHIHINLLGFMGLTILGTIPVLMPTVLRSPDPHAVKQLHQALPWSVAGAFGIAVGASFDSLFGQILAAAATLAYGWPIVRLLWHYWRHYGTLLVSAEFAAPLLTTALIAMVLLLMHGIGHDFGLLRPRDALPLFVVACLIPVISGASCQLLPVWLRPGAHGEWQNQLRHQLTRFSRTRAVWCLIAGGLTVSGNGPVSQIGLFMGILAVLWLLVMITWATISAFWQRRLTTTIGTGPR